MLMIRDFSNRFQQISGMPINSKGGKDMLKRTGIDTNSKQYQAVMKSMSAACSGVGYTNVQAIKNRMSRYDKDGDYIDPTTGLAGLLVTEENVASRKRIISIPESSRDEMFELTKKEFLQGNGMGDGDTTKRSDVYTDLYRKTSKNDRLAAGHTLSQYERAYTQAFIAAAKAADPAWKAGKPIKPGALDGITRESVEANLKKSSSSLSSVDIQI